MLKSITFILAAAATIAVAQAEHPVPFDVKLLAVDANEGCDIADLDGDGKLDIVAGRNWYRNGEWTARPVRIIEDNNGYVRSNGEWAFDVNGDGTNDVINSVAHGYGIHWWRGMGPDAEGKLQFEEHLIDDSFSQPHCFCRADLDGDGSEELITGKRIRAHNGNDPGAAEPGCAYPCSSGGLGTFGLTPRSLRLLPMWICFPHSSNCATYQCPKPCRRMGSTWHLCWRVQRKTGPIA